MRKAQIQDQRGEGMKKEEAELLKNIIDGGYHNRKDYPPFALSPWEDRNRYRDYIFKIIDEQVKP